jgi:hypothetical protein
LGMKKERKLWRTARIKKAPRELFQEFFSRKNRELHRAFNHAIKTIPKIYRGHSVHDITSSLFVSSLWLPNISSLIKHQLLVAILASMKPENFSDSKLITNYSEFSHFLKKIYDVLPNFFMLEDYIPEIDWGDVKFYHNRRMYKIFFGQELCSVYEYLTLFQMLYLPFEKEYYNYTGRSPTKELSFCLQLQDEIISGITLQPKPEDLSGLSPGYIEIPPLDFWEIALEFYNHFDVRESHDKTFINAFSLELGTFPSENLNCDKFQGMVHLGRVIPKFFISHREKYFPILPRRFSAILFDLWSEIFEDNHEKIVPGHMPYSVNLGAELHKYIKARIKCEFLEPVVSAVTQEGPPHKILFSSGFMSKNRLILVYVTNPCYSGDRTGEELNAISNSLGEALELIKRYPQTLALHLKRQNVEFQPKTGKQLLKPELIVIIPQTTMAIHSLKIPASFPGKIMFMDHFLGIVDELENRDMFSSFLEYWEEYGDLIENPFISPLDIFGSFKDSYGVLLEGAVDYTYVSIDPHWGSRLRYKSLEEFWRAYPEVHFFDNPRSWRLKKETESRLRLEARGYFGCALYCKIGLTHVFINSPFDMMGYEQGLTTNMLMECLEDALSRNKSIISQLRYFKDAGQFQVLFFPASLVTSTDKFNHLNHLIPGDELWRSDTGMIEPGVHGIRVVFNDNRLMEVFETVEDQSVEVSIFSEILKELDGISPDSNMPSILDLLEKRKTGRPRFKMARVNKNVSFPEFVNPDEPEPVHFKKARKRISELAKQRGFDEGNYSLEDAKLKIDAIKKSIIDEINSEVNKYDFIRSAPFLITRNDALTDHYERSTFQIKKSLEHDVDYNRAERHSKEETKYIRMHKNYRYLIEKCVQLRPRGTSEIDVETFQYLIALIDWLHVFYTASDSLWYGLDPVLGIKVDNQYLVEVVHEKDFSEKEKIFAEERTEIRLGIGVNTEDDVSSLRSMPDFINALDLAFKKDLGFTFKNMINVLQVLCCWADFNPQVLINPYYYASGDEIKETCSKNISGFVPEETDPILRFLTLRNEDVIRVIGQGHVCDDIPVWEHRKRFSRYALRPLISFGDKYYWGPYSARKSATIWSGNLSYGSLPTDLESQTIQREIDGEKQLIDKALEKKAYEIVRRFTPYAVKNCTLHNRDRSGGHPTDLGDYDVLAFYKEKNTILNIECKDILPPFCLKDAIRLRRTIFGEDNGDEGHFKQINKRRNYLLRNIQKICNGLNWSIDLNNLPKVVTIYLTRETYWWTRFPPKDTGVLFLQSIQLSMFIESL